MYDPRFVLSFAFIWIINTYKIKDQALGVNSRQWSVPLAIEVSGTLHWSSVT